jgi:hypothetical protein
MTAVIQIYSQQCYCKLELFFKDRLYVAQASLKLAILLLLPPKCWDYRHVPTTPGCNLKLFVEGNQIWYYRNPVDFNMGSNLGC